jgi:hypothetical protein
MVALAVVAELEAQGRMVGQQSHFLLQFLRRVIAEEALVVVVGPVLILPLGFGLVVGQPQQPCGSLVAVGVRLAVHPTRPVRFLA